MLEIQIGTPLGFRMTIPHHEQKSMGILFFDGRRFRFLVCDMMWCRKCDITPKKRNAKALWAVPSSSGNRNDVPLRFACGEQSVRANGIRIVPTAQIMIISDGPIGKLTEKIKGIC